MECPVAGSPLEEAARKTCGVMHGVDPQHRCDLKTCKFKMANARIKENGRAARIFVCTSSLHIHRCGVGVCKLPQHLAPSLSESGWTCPISGIEVQSQDEVFCLTKSKEHGKADQWTNTSNSKESQKCRSLASRTAARRASASKRFKRARSMTQSHLETLLLSEASRLLRVQEAKRAEKLVTSAVLQAGMQFTDQMRAARQAYPKPLLKTTLDPAVLKALAAAIDEFSDRTRPHLDVFKGHAAMVAACCTFLTSGMTSNGVTMFPVLPWLKTLMPHPTDIGKINGFQCRPVSIMCRNIKATMHGRSGQANARLLFKCPDWLRTVSFPGPEY